VDRFDDTVMTMSKRDNIVVSVEIFVALPVIEVDTLAPRDRDRLAIEQSVSGPEKAVTPLDLDSID
jgi:hypothetical protein